MTCICLLLDTKQFNLIITRRIVMMDGVSVSLNDGVNYFNVLIISFSIYNKFAVKKCNMLTTFGDTSKSVFLNNIYRNTKHN